MATENSNTSTADDKQSHRETAAADNPLIYRWHDDALNGLLISGRSVGRLLSQARHMARGARTVIALNQNSLEREPSGDAPAISVLDRENLNLSMIASLEAFDEWINELVEHFKERGVPKTPVKT